MPVPGEDTRVFVRKGCWVLSLVGPSLCVYTMYSFLCRHRPVVSYILWYMEQGVTELEAIAPVEKLRNKRTLIAWVRDYVKRCRGTLPPSVPPDPFVFQTKWFEDKLKFLQCHYELHLREKFYGHPVLSPLRRRSAPAS